MARQDDFKRAPYAPAYGILVPIVSIALSLPTILIGIVWVSAGAYFLVTGHGLNVNSSSTLQVPAPVCLALVFGPMASAVLCTTQRTRAEQVYGSALLLGYRMRQLNRIAPWCAALGIAMLPAIAVVSVVAISLRPQ
jgi:hypothetical protein